MAKKKDKEEKTTSKKKSTTVGNGNNDLDDVIHSPTKSPRPRSSMMKDSKSFSKRLNLSTPKLLTDDDDSDDDSDNGNNKEKAKTKTNGKNGKGDDIPGSIGIDIDISSNGNNTRNFKTRGGSIDIGAPKEVQVEDDEEGDDVHAAQIAKVRNQLRQYEIPLTKSDIVMVMQGWNKVLAFTTAFTEALLIKWRILCTIHVLELERKEHEEQRGNDDGEDDVDASKQKKKESSKSSIMTKVLQLCDNNQDPLGVCMGDRIADTETLLLRLIDSGIRSTCHTLQNVQREAYRAIEDELLIHPKEIVSLECSTPKEIFKIFARRGVTPQYWKLFLDSFLWCMKTHVPYAQDDDYDELNKLGNNNAFSKVISQTVIIPAITAFQTMKSYLSSSLFSIGVQRFWDRISDEAKAGFGQTFYQTLLTENSDLLDYFSKTDMDSLSFHLMQTLSLLVHSILSLCHADNAFRRALEAIGERHRKLGIPTFAYAIVGGHLLKCLKPLFDMEEEITKNDPNYSITATELNTAFAFLYTEVASLLHFPMLLQEQKVQAARDYYTTIGEELNWSDAVIGRRMLVVEQEISAKGTYHQTSEEIEWGARLAWRNSAKCIGRIAWKTLQVRDKRHVKNPQGIFNEVEEHLKLSTAGTNIQSIMTVFEPRKPNELFGTRFWSSQFVRYAAYKDPKTDSIIGDPANLDLTEYLIDMGYWTPPTKLGRFDVLPVVLKVPHREKPHVYQLPSRVIYEVMMEHPTKKEITNLGYKWSTVPAISNFRMNLGGVVYANMPFNGWFVSSEITRNLMERYDAGPAIAKALKIDMATNPCWRLLAFAELEVAVNHSFQKNGYTIVDPHTVGNQFCTHVQREREQHGRECPGQWSWIGGLTGPTNPTWHLEMRDFLLLPQYEYCADDLLLHTSYDGIDVDDVTTAGQTFDETASMSSFVESSTRLPRVLIAFGSETGNAEGVARRLKRELGLLKPLVKGLNDVVGLDIVKSRKLTHVICICSTFGKGEPPSNARIFFDKDITLNPDKAPHFAVLALGSTIYPDFCAAGRKLDGKLESAGLNRMLSLYTADEAAGADESISSFLNMIKSTVMPPAVEQELIAMAESFMYEPIVTQFNWHGSIDKNLERWSEEKTYLCIQNEELLDPTGSSRSTRKITFQLPEGVTYESGDHVSICPLNSEKLVRRFIRLFETELTATATSNPVFGDLSNDEMIDLYSMKLFELESIEEGERMTADVFFKTPTTLLHVLESYIDLSLSSKNIPEVLGLLKRFLDELFEKLDHQKGEFDVVSTDDLVVEVSNLFTNILETTSDKVSGAMDDVIARFPTIVEFMDHFKPLFLDNFIAKELGWKNSEPIVKMAEVLQILPRLQPRFYSISSSNRASPDKVSITVGVLKATTSAGKKIEGVCSHYLASLTPNVSRVKVSITKSTFRLPQKTDSPLIMVGAGTGLAPMMGFLDDRRLDQAAQANLGPIHLFFGCRTKDDLIYKDLIETYEKDKLLDFHLALSRPTDTETKKMYVQHRLYEMGKELYELLQNPDTHYYVCGDARMADSCFDSCVNVLREHGSVSRVWAVQLLKKMRLEGRWQTDVWGIVSHFEEAKKSIETKKKTAAKIWLQQLKGGGDDN